MSCPVVHFASPEPVSPVKLANPLLHLALQLRSHGPRSGTASVIS